MTLISDLESGIINQGHCTPYMQNIYGPSGEMFGPDEEFYS